MFYVKVNAYMVNKKNGASISIGTEDGDGGTVSCGYSVKPSSYKSTVGTVFMVPDSVDTVFVSVTPSSDYSFVSSGAEVKEMFKGSYVLADGKTYSESYATITIPKSISESASTPDTAIVIDFYAYMASNVKTLHYNWNGGVNGPSDATFTAGETLTIGAGPTFTGKTFSGWNLAGTTTVYQARSQATFTEDTTLYAMWSSTDYQPERYSDSLVYKV